MQLFPRNSCKILVSCSGFTRRGGLVRPASKSSRFSHHPLRVPKAWHGDFAACGQRSGLLALNLASIFEKLLDQKTFRFCARTDDPTYFSSCKSPWQSFCNVSCETLLLGKPIACGSAESLRCLPLCCSPVVVLSELLMNLS